MNETDDTVDGEIVDDSTVRGDLFNYIIDSVEYDFREDYDEVLGNWRITRDGDLVSIAYDPYPDSPYPAKSATYRVTRVSESAP
ncbi:MAG: hypothetical protein ACREQ5_00880 [Candidatus Dormibacteria bacterium]